MTADDDFLWRVEAACRHAWPTASETLVDGWLVRAGGGATWRLNSINPTQHGPRDPASLLGESGVATVRVPAIARGLDTALDRLGFGPAVKETVTLAMALPIADTAPATEVVLEESPTATWLAARGSLGDLDAAAAAQLAATVALVPAPRRFARLAQAGSPVAVGFAAVIEKIAVLEAIAVDRGHRRQGHGHALVMALLGWAGTTGASHACLQVQADNLPARALYRSLGFTHELYRYHYRHREAAGGGR